MTAPDISCEGLAALTLHFGSLPNPSHAVATVLALRAALDAAERERDEAHSRGDDWCDQAQKMRRERDAAVREIGNTAREATAAADATGYARGVKDAADACKAAKLPQHLVESGPMAGWQTFNHEWPATIHAAILALLIDVTEESQA